LQKSPIWSTLIDGSWRLNTDWILVLNMIRFPDRDPTGVCISESDLDWTGF